MNRLILSTTAVLLLAASSASAVEGFTVGVEYANGSWSADPVALRQSVVPGQSLSSASAAAFTDMLTGDRRSGLNLHLGWNVLGHALIEGAVQSSFWSPFDASRQGGVGLAGGRLTWYPAELAARLAKRAWLTDRFYDLGLEFGGGYTIGGGKAAKSEASPYGALGVDGTYVSFGVTGEVWMPGVRWVSLVGGWRHFAPSWTRFYTNYRDNFGADLEGFESSWNTLHVGLSFHVTPSRSPQLERETADLRARMEAQEASARRAVEEARAAAAEARLAAEAARAEADARAAAVEKVAVADRAARQRDTDGDGVDDFADGCPDQAGTASNKGCPDPDRDRDGVVDRLDNCPDRKGSAANRGCKSKQKVAFGEQAVVTNHAGKVVGIESGSVRVEHDDGTVGTYLINGRASVEAGERLAQGVPVGRVAILETFGSVSFKRGGASIDKKSQGLLEQVAEVVAAHGEITRLIVEVSTGERKSDASNRSLALERANAVVKQLTEQGIAAGRLEARGESEGRLGLAVDKKRSRDSDSRVRFIVIR